MLDNRASNHARNWALVLSLSVLLLLPAVASATPCSVLDQFSGTNSQMGRIFRDGNASACPGKAYPGGYNPGSSFYYETYRYTNTSGAAACVTINFDPFMGTSPCGSGYNAHISAYLGSYDPANQAANFVGDIGSSNTGSFSVEVPAATDLVLVVTNTSSPQLCSYAFDVVNIACGDADLALSKSVSTTMAQPGQLITYTLEVTNNGPGAVTGVTVTDVLPAGVEYDSDGCGGSYDAGTRTWTWAAGTIADGATAACGLQVRVSAASGEVVNTATVSGDSTDPTPANDSASATFSAQGAAIPALDAIGMSILLILIAAAGWIIVRRLP